MKLRTLLAAAALGAASIASAQAEPVQFEFWHAMGGQLGERVDQMAADFNASQDKYEAVAVYKGNYTETMTAAIAAFRAKEQPHIVQVFEVGTATMMAAEGKGAVYPVYKLMEDAGVEFDQSAYLPAVISYYTDTDNKLLSLPFNSSTPVLWYNKTKLDEMGIAAPTTWDELEAAAAKAKAGGVEAPLSFGWQSWSQIENFLAWHNQAIGTKANGFEGTDTELTINSDAVVRHLDRIARMGKDGTFRGID